MKKVLKKLYEAKDAVMAEYFEINTPLAIKDIYHELSKLEKEVIRIYDETK